MEGIIFGILRYIYVVKWSPVFKDLKGDCAEQSVSDEKKSSL